MRAAIGSSRHARFGANRRTPLFASTRPAAPTPIATTWGSSNPLAASIIAAIVASGSSAGVTERERDRMDPSLATRRDSIFVPPTSMPSAWAAPDTSCNSLEAEQRADPAVAGQPVGVNDRLHPAALPHGPGHRFLDHVGHGLHRRTTRRAPRSPIREPPAGGAGEPGSGQIEGDQDLRSASLGDGGERPGEAGHGLAPGLGCGPQRLHLGFLLVSFLL